MLPDRCTVRENSKQCVNPPEFVISILDDSGQYMIGVTCARHRSGVSGKIRGLQQQGKIPDGKIDFEPLKPVGTDCIRAGADDLIQLD